MKIMQCLLLLASIGVFNPSTQGMYTPVYHDRYGIYQNLSLFPLSVEARAIIEKSQTKKYERAPINCEATPLLWDTQSNDLVKTYCSMKADARYQASSYLTLLMHYLSAPKDTELLALKQESVNTLVETHLSCMGKNPVLLECMLSHFNPETRSRFSNFTFHRAAHTNSPQLITFLLAKGFNINAKHVSYLHAAVHAGSLSIVKILLEHGTNPNRLSCYFEDSDGAPLFTPLDLAYKKNNKQVQQLLREYGAHIKEIE